MMNLLGPDDHQALFVSNNALSARKLICEGRRRYPLSSLPA
jgi:hypothetical protein